MQEINYTGQERSARSSPIASAEEAAEAVFGRAGSEFEDEEDETTSGKYRCRVCDKPLESFGFVCEECRKRDDEFIERDTELEFMRSEEEAYRQQMEEKERMTANESRVKASREGKRMGKMRYKKPLIAEMLDAIEAETAMGRASGNLAGHLAYIHRLVHELEDRLYRSNGKQCKEKNMSAIEYTFRKLAYKSDIDEEAGDYE